MPRIEYRNSIIKYMKYLYNTTSNDICENVLCFISKCDNDDISKKNSLYFDFSLPYHN